LHHELCIFSPPLCLILKKKTKKTLILWHAINKAELAEFVIN